MYRRSKGADKDSFVQPIEIYWCPSHATFQGKQQGKGDELLALKEHRQVHDKHALCCPVKVPAKCYGSKKKDTGNSTSKEVFGKGLTVEASFDLNLIGWAISQTKKKEHEHV